MTNQRVKKRGGEDDGREEEGRREERMRMTGGNRIEDEERKGK